MEYKEATEWLFQQLPMFSRVGSAAYKPGLERSERLAEYFGNPERKWKSIHVGGTNGKGSVSSLIAATLQTAGYKTGLYTSPHLVDFRERMRINGEMISESEVIDFVERWQQSDYTGDKPSFFELTMMMAFDWFAKQEVDIAVIEVGMGGRLDSTNIITPVLSVITNISKDHTQFLGDTLEKIATEKAGIIKRDIPAVIGEATKETEIVFRNRAETVKAPIIEAYNQIDITRNRQLECALKGDYQEKNVNTARVAIEELRKLGYSIDDQQMKYAFQNVEQISGFKGRWTILSQAPLIICDTGHNEAGLKYNLNQLSRLKSQRSTNALRFVIGFVADKDVEHILPMFPKDAIYYFTQASIPRAMKVERLKELATGYGLKGNVYSTVKEAKKAAINDSATDDIIYIGGSTFVVAEIL